MSYIPPVQTSGQQVSGQDLAALSNKPSVKDLASIVARSIPQQPSRNTVSNRPLPIPQQLPAPITFDPNTLPPPMDFQPMQQDDYSLPPSDMPPELPADFIEMPKPIIIEEKTHAKSIEVILPKPINSSLPFPNPSIVISSPRPLTIVQKVEEKAPVFDKDALAKMAKLNDRADLNSWNEVSGDSFREVHAKAQAQGFRWDSENKFFVKGEDLRLWSDFETEVSSVKPIVNSAEDEALAKEMELKFKLETKISREEEEARNFALALQFEEKTEVSPKIVSDDESLAEEMELKFKLETKKSKEEEEAKNLALAMLLIDEEKEKATFLKLLEEAKQAEDLALAQQIQAKSQHVVNPRVQCCLSDDNITMLEQCGWKLNFEGGFGIDSSGEILLFDEIKNNFGL